MRSEKPAKRVTQFEKAAESEVWNAITAFQEILKAMPDDRTALETLFEAYDHLGDRKKALYYLNQLAELLLEDSDAESLKSAAESLRRLGSHNEKSLALITRLEDAMESLGVRESRPREGRVTSGKKDIECELSLAWKLLQAQEITQEEYSAIAQDLTENSMKNVDVPVTVLHVLNDRAMKNHDRILVYLSRESGVPIISLTHFELNRAAVTLLPGSFRQHKGAVSFELMGSEVMVALLNPDNAMLRKEVERTIGRKCHFYLVASADYDEALNRIQHMLEVSAV